MFLRRAVSSAVLHSEKIYRSPDNDWLIHMSGIRQAWFA